MTTFATDNGSEWACIDADVHPTVVGGMKTVMKYVPVSWQRRFETASLPTSRFDSPVGTVRKDAKGPNGEPPASNPKLIQDDLLDKHDVIFATLISLEAARAAYMPSARDSAMLMSAFNQHFADEWLDADKRMRYAIAVPSTAPEAAAAEIRKYAGDSRIACVYLPLTNILMGDPHYYPIYAAAEEAGMPVMVHPANGEGQYQGAPTLAGGLATSYAERHAMLPQLAQSSVISLVFEGVLERFPTVKFVFTEYGFSWVPHVMWRMDKNWRGLRPSLPWIKKSPIDYIRERIRFTSQPIEEPPVPEMFGQLLTMMHADQTLIFSSDYPHWDNDFPRRTFVGLDPGLRRRILVDNAAETFRLS